VAAVDDEERGSWHLRSAGAWTFALALWLAGLGGTPLFARDGIEVGWAHANGVPGTVTIEKCAHSSSYALCYGPFEAADRSVRRPRLELRTIRQDQPGAAVRAWLPSRTAGHGWAGDVDPWRQLLPAAPFAVLTLVQTIWIAASWRAWRRRKRLGENGPGKKATREATLRDPALRTGTLPEQAPYGRPTGVARMPVPTDPMTAPLPPATRPPPFGSPPRFGSPPPFGSPASVGRPRGTASVPPPPPLPSPGRTRASVPPLAPPPQPPRPRGTAQPPIITPGYQEHPEGAPGGTDRQRPGWQDLRGTAVPPGPSAPQPRARRQPWERPEHG
jgi:hypothetical protein